MINKLGQTTNETPKSLSQRDIMRDIMPDNRRYGGTSYAKSYANLFVSSHAGFGFGKNSSVNEFGASSWSDRPMAPY